MDKILIRALNEDEKVPFDLLLLADPSIDMINHYIGCGTIRVAVSESQIVGVCVLIQTDPFHMEISNIAVNEHYQGKGIGKRLVSDAIGTARENGAKVLEIGTGNSSLSQLALYQKSGFRITGVERDYFIKHYSQDIYENGIQCTDLIRLSMDL